MFRKKLSVIFVMAVMVAHAAITVPLNGTWRLDYFPQPHEGAVRVVPLTVPFKTVSATVPGNCELDLVQAGILPPMEKGLNVTLLRPYEGYQWLYTKTFDAPEMDYASGARAVLSFNGIDTLADIFLNGEKVGESENMYIEHRFDVTRRLKKGAKHASGAAAPRFTGCAQGHSG